MGIVDWLRKLGILRWGTKSTTYTNATERPAELMMNDVFCAEKDLITGDDKLPSKKKAR